MFLWEEDESGEEFSKIFGFGNYLFGAHTKPKLECVALFTV